MHLSSCIPLNLKDRWAARGVCVCVCVVHMGGEFSVRDLLQQLSTANAKSTKRTSSCLTTTLPSAARMQSMHR